MNVTKLEVPERKYEMYLNESVNFAHQNIKVIESVLSNHADCIRELEARIDALGNPPVNIPSVWTTEQIGVDGKITVGSTCNHTGIAQQAKIEILDMLYMHFEMRMETQKINPIDGEEILKLLDERRKLELKKRYDF